MFSRRLQFSLFVAAFHQHYRARLADMVSPFATRQIIDLLVCLKQDRLISAFIVYTSPHQTAFRRVRIVFYYINNNGLLFQHVRSVPERFFVSKLQIQQWVRQKASLAFPILVFETPTHGIVTDRQLVYLQLHQKTSTYLGGRLLARIDNY